MSFLRDVIYDRQRKLGFQWARLKFGMLRAFKPYRFAKPMRGKISDCFTYGRIGMVRRFFCARCGRMLDYGRKRCSVCGQRLTWRQ